MSTRFSFVHIGVAALVAAGAATAVGVAQRVGAAPSAGASTFVPIVPCRLADTRPLPDLIGTRPTPLGAGETATFAVWGTNGNCTIPTTATGVAMNATAVGPSSAGFVTIFPADAALPTTSNLNFVAGAPPTPNQVTVGLSAAGAIKAFNKFGAVSLIIDIVGYYEPAGAGATGPTGPAGATGPRGFSAWDTIPSGTAVRGEYQVSEVSSGPGTRAVNMPFSFVASNTLTNALVNFAALTVSSGSIVASDADSTCTGNYFNPTAPAGKVCIYMDQNSGVATIQGVQTWGALPSTGFAVSYTTSAPAGTQIFVPFTWAYTAP